ncbi:hypothetical protein Tsubulata_013653 [Turnera subulata]|uniref:Ricin B lectin domain-containing protein n=1 Tax=Turnera subulata TaxID=218843 RepID=A0A9Q0GEQ2_9ROSI|nr:hypothetical protein Tsubulata_013653 [Turnera subulata]
MMMKLSKMAWVCLILVLVILAPFRISGVEELQEDPKLSGPQPPVVLQQSLKRGGEGQRIRGPKGLCIDVPGGQYYDGAEVFLWLCVDKNQQWTFEEDGTIRSSNNYYCLMPKNGCPVSPPNYLMISRCPNNPSGSSAQWSYERFFEGFILHEQTGLVLTAKSDVQGQRGALTVDVDKRLPGQGWVLDDGPSLQRLESGAATGRCLTVESDGYTVGLGSCVNSTRNNWEIITFSSVGNNGKCLSCQDSERRAIPCKDGSRVAARDCCVGLPSQRWVNWDSRFVNLESGLYLTLDKSGDRVIAAQPIKGTTTAPSQTWIFL